MFINFSTGPYNEAPGLTAIAETVLLDEIHFQVNLESLHNIWIDFKVVWNYLETLLD